MTGADITFFKACIIEAYLTQQNHSFDLAMYCQAHHTSLLARTFIVYTTQLFPIWKHWSFSNWSKKLPVYKTMRDCELAVLLTRLGTFSSERQTVQPSSPDGSNIYLIHTLSLLATCLSDAAARTIWGKMGDRDLGPPIWSWNAVFGCLWILASWLAS